MLIPVDERDQLPDDVAALARSSDLVAPHEIPLGSTRLNRATWPGVSRLTQSYLAPSPALGDDVPILRDEPMRVPKLEYWTVQAHAYTVDAAAKVSLLGRLFGGEAKAALAGVVHEAKRFTVQTTEQGRHTEFGVAVRIYAATKDWDTKLQLTLPNLAADAQLNARDSRVAIDVVGYSGALGALLPSPERLDVESLAAYLAAFTTSRPPSSAMPGYHSSRQHYSPMRRVCKGRMRHGVLAFRLAVTPMPTSAPDSLRLQPPSPACRTHTWTNDRRWPAYGGHDHGQRRHRRRARQPRTPDRFDTRVINRSSANGLIRLPDP